MSTQVSGQTALGDNAARQLANATKTVPQLSTITPRWLTHLLQWVPVEAGIYRLNRVKDPEAVQATCTAREDEGVLPTTFVPYEEQPREYFLNAVSTVLDVHTRISDLYSSPHDQIKEQLRLTIETIKELQESQLINNADYGLLANVDDSQRIFPLHRRAHARRHGRTAEQGVEGARLLPHPPAGDRRLRPRMHAARRAAAHGQPVRLAVHHRRGIPLIPSDKVPVADGKTKILLLRVGDKRRGVVGLYQPGVAGEQGPPVGALHGHQQPAIASYLISLYCSLAVHSPDALAVLDDVEIGKYHDYADTYR